MKHVHGPWSHSLVVLGSNESNESLYWFTLLSAILLFPEGIFKIILWHSCCCQSKCRFSRTRTLTHPFLLCTLRNYSMMITFSHLVEPLRLSVSSFVCVDHKLTGCFEGCHFPNCWHKSCRGDKSTKLDHQSQICQRNVTKLNTQQTCCIHDRGQSKNKSLVKKTSKNPQGIVILHLKTEFPGCYIALVFRQAGP